MEHRFTFLHTSDWHLGRTLYGKQRYDEFSSYLDWLIDIIIQEEVSLLLIAGDVFDTSTPSNRSQELYYQFLCRIAASPCRNVVIIGGNHDSPSFLSAPKDLLKSMNIHVTAAACENTEDELMLMKSESGKPEAVVCAVPYLRDRDIRIGVPGETDEEKMEKIQAGVQEHYLRVCTAAEELSRTYGTIPILATGHVFAAGGEVHEGDGVRELYIGTLSHLSSTVFPDSIDYLALGHLHSPQTVSGNEHMRYCGSPLPLGFGDCHKEKQVVLGTFTGRNLSVRNIAVPCFQKLSKAAGTLEEVLDSIQSLKQQNIPVWLEAEYSGEQPVVQLRELIDDAAADSQIEVLRVSNKFLAKQVLHSMYDQESLEDLDVHTVFSRCMDAWNLNEETRKRITGLYHEVLRRIDEADVKEEDERL